MSTTIKRWRLHLWSGKIPTDLAQSINMHLPGWINYYGRFYPCVLARFLKRIDQYLVRWAIQKYKRVHRRRLRSWTFQVGIKTREPNLFAHWRFNVQTNNRMMGVA